MSDELFFGLWLLAALTTWTVLALIPAALIGRALSHRHGPTLAERMHAAGEGDWWES